MSFVPDSGVWKGSTSTAGAVLRAMAEGRVLRHRDEDGWAIIACPADPPHEKDPVSVPVSVSQEVAQELMGGTLIGRLTEHRNRRKAGWRDLGFTEPADYYCLVQ
jgi:hypothetical protein